MTQKGPRGERNCKKNRVTGRAGEREGQKGRGLRAFVLGPGI